MKKVLLFVHLLLIVVATTYAQSLNEDFEGDQFPPKGWETRCIEYSLLSYPKWEQVNNKDINTFKTVIRTVGSQHETQVFIVSYCDLRCN